ncbi:MAG TPA: alpha/beta fold hydrolase [Gaiellaceae bacterium]|nr:alpha/beta fold hydrolase [Gaiellaceae bacterium]
MTAPPVVLVHGITASTDWWRSTARALEGHDVHVARLPGFRYREAAAWLADWIEAEGLHKAAVVGHSMGGTVSLVLAAQRPDLVERLALIAPAGIFAARSRRSYVLPIARSVGVSPRRIMRAARDAARIGPLRLWQVGSDLLASDIRDTLHRVEAPTLILWGADDRLLPPTLGSVFSSELPNAELVVLERCGHIPMLEAPDALHQELRRFLQEPADERG